MQVDWHMYRGPQPPQHVFSGPGAQHLVSTCSSSSGGGSACEHHAMGESGTMSFRNSDCGTKSDGVESGDTSLKWTESGFEIVISYYNETDAAEAIVRAVLGLNPQPVYPFICKYGSGNGHLSEARVGCSDKSILPEWLPKEPADQSASPAD